MPETPQTEPQQMPPYVEPTVVADHISAHIDPLTFLKPGDRVDDFTIVKELGRGGFASVYLARQNALDRLVALKISGNRGIGEAQTLAGLEHEHIVKVFSEFVEPHWQRHCLVLQYVAGTNLHSLIRHVFQNGKRKPTQGREFLEAIDQLSVDEVGFDPSALANRDILFHSTHPEAVCWIGGQLAQGLSVAHARKILHCDVKPANILLNRYGRPMLVDFNVAIDSRARTGLGGTLDYMSPEQLQAIAAGGSPDINIDGRSDIYSLGIVLFEALTGQLPFERIQRVDGKPDISAEIAKRQQPLPQRLEMLRSTSPAMARVIERCLDPNPERRYWTGMELAEALSNARELVRIERRLPPPGMLTAFAQKHLLLAFILVTVVPNLIGSVVNIGYNTVEIHLETDAQQSLFPKLILGYNLIAYPLCMAIMAGVIARFFRQWWQFNSSAGMTNDDVNRFRDFVLKLTRRAVFLASVGWFPGALFFPLAIDLIQGPIDFHIYTHFAISFVLSGLIAVVYTYFGVQWIVLRVLYPKLDIPDRDRSLVVADELKRSRKYLDLFQILAGVVPLVGAILLVLLAHDSMTISFRILATGLILLGMLGLGVALRVSEWLGEVLHVLGDDRDGSTLAETTSRFMAFRDRSK